MIGNPNTLNKNSEFDYIIKECQRHNTFVGHKTNKESEPMLDRAMRDLSLSTDTINSESKNKKRIPRSRTKSKDTNEPSITENAKNDEKNHKDKPSANESKKQERANYCKSFIVQFS